MTARTICHECGEETTHRSKYQIYKDDAILTVCPVCHARYIRERTKNGRLTTGIVKRPCKNVSNNSIKRGFSNVKTD